MNPITADIEFNPSNRTGKNDEKGFGFGNVLRKGATLRMHAGIGCLLIVALVGLTGQISAQGITQPTFTAAEVNKVIGTFAQAATGDRVTLFEFQHGNMYIASGSGSGGTTRDSWWNLTNPRSPVLMSSLPANHGKPHNIVVWGTYFSYDPNGSDMTVWDWNTRMRVGVATQKDNAMVDAWQPPYAFTGQHGYQTGAALQGWDVSNPSTISQTFLRDTSTAPGFKLQTAAAIGNLLICAGASGPGVAVYDISDPANPILRGSRVDGTGSIYTAQIYGNRLYQCQGNGGIRVYDFSDPSAIQLVGTVPTGGNARYITFKDGKAYVPNGGGATSNVRVFDTTSLATLQTIVPDGNPIDAVYMIGNMMAVGEGTYATAQSSRATARMVALQQNPDTSPPAVVYGNPSNNSVNVGLKSRIGFSMSRQMDVNSLTPATFIVRPQGTVTGIPGTYSSAMGVINFAPASPLLANTTYEVILTAGGIKDNVGNAFATTTVQMVFSTGSSISNPSATALTHHWKLEGNFSDSAGSNHGVNTGVTFTTGREGAQAGVFNGSGFTNVSTINLGNTFSLSGYVWVNAGATESQTIMANCASGATTNGLRFFVNTAGTGDGKLIFQTGNGTLGASAASAAGAVASGAWNHVAVTVNRTNGTAVIYVNGANVTVTSAARTDFANTTAVHLGQMTDNSRRLTGRLDGVRIYSDVRTAAQIATMIAEDGNVAPVIVSMTSSLQSSVVNAPVTFAVNATDANSDALGYSFDYGDGGGQGPFTSNNTRSYTYTLPGRYTVYAAVRDSGGAVTRSKLQIVHKPLTSTNATASAQILSDAQRTKIWNVNPDSNTVTRIDGGTLTKDYEIGVGVKPRTLALRPGVAEIWVTCETSDQIYVLDAASATGAVLATLAAPQGSRPMGICFSPDGAAVYVTYMDSGLLAKWNPATRTQTATLSVGPTPRPIAISGDSNRIFVGRFLSPTAPFAVTGEVGEVREISASAFTVTRTFALAHDLTPDSQDAGRGTPNYLLQMAITPDGERLFVPSKKDNVDRGAFRDGLPLTSDNSVRSIFSKLDLVNNVEASGERVDIDNHGLNHGVAFSPLGDLAFIASQGNNDVSVFNAYNGALITTIGLAAELAPQDLVFNTSGSRLFVMNFMTRTVSAFDTSGLVSGTGGAPAPLAVISTVAAETLTATVLKGKQVFYNSADPRMAAEGYMSCASCHLDGESDQRTWDFTHQGEGLRNTHSLRGHGGMAHGNIHWTGNFDEVQDFEIQIRNLFGGDGFIANGTPNSSLGAPNSGRSVDLDSLADYVSSLTTTGKSPFKNADGSLTTDAVAGRQLFEQLNCVACHKGNNFTDSVLSATSYVFNDVGTLKASSGKRLGAPLTALDTPTIRGLWNTGPYLHDGSAATLLDVITTQNSNNLHGTTTTLSTTQKNQLVAYLHQVDDLESVVFIPITYTNSWAVGTGAAGTANWSSPGIWVNGIVPGSRAGDAINFVASGNNAIVINNHAPVTLGNMSFGARPGKNYTLGVDTNNYGLTFNNRGAGASLANEPAETVGRVTINNPITLMDSLTVTNNASTTGVITLAGIVGENGGSRPLTINGGANGGTGGVTLTKANTSDLTKRPR